MSRGPGPIERELRRKQYDGADANFCAFRTDRRGRTCRNERMLSKPARGMVNSAYTELTGMLCHCNDYYLADALSEAIEAAEALGL